MVRNTLLITVYNLVNLLFVYKYSLMLTRHNLLICLLYFVIINIFFARLWTGTAGGHSVQRSGRTDLLITAMLVTALFILMKQFDPSSIQVDRYTAIHQWLDRLLAGQYPYSAESRPSALPFLFLLSFPFYLLGDPGLLQIAALLVFVVIARDRTLAPVPMTRLRVLLLVLSPAFLYELVVRSDLMSNVILVIFFGLILDKAMVTKARPALIFCLGAFGGLVIATRLVVLPVYMLFLARHRAARRKDIIRLVTGNILGFAAMTVPFILWDAGRFLGEGPFAIQSGYVSPWVLVIVVPLTLLLCMRVDSLASVLEYSGTFLFLAVLLPFVESIIYNGWADVFFDDRFDISYFVFCLPFIILSLDFHRREPSRVSCTR